MAQRIKGQEIELLIVQDNVPLTSIGDVRSLEIAAKIETLQEGYLGETTDRYDAVYKGFRGRMELHFENGDVLDFIRTLIDKARRRVPGVRVNVKATFAFPGGGRKRLLLKDLSFGEIPISFGSRTDYGTISLEFAGEDYNQI